MKNSIKYIIAVTFTLSALNGFSQMEKGRTVLGGEFSFFNSRNKQSSSNFSFDESSKTSFSFSLIGGKFISNRWFLYGMAGINYDKTKESSEFTTSTLYLNRRFIEVVTPSLGVGVRKYIPATERLGFFIQGQASFSNSFVKQDNYWVDEDTVRNDSKVTYPFYSLSINVNPGVYLNLSPRWQLTFNLGNLYFIQTWRPEKDGIISRRNDATFGMDVNLFDFRIGALYFLGKTAPVKLPPPPSAPFPRPPAP